VRVLVVEDEHRLAAALRDGLEAEGFVVDVAGDGDEGLWRASEYGYDAIVLDLMLPRLNGYRVCTMLRDRQVWTPILMLTAKDGEWDEVEALDSGADDFLTKPFSYAVLLARLRSLLRRGAPERPVALSAGPVTLDPATQQTWLDGEPVELSPRERRVLEYLLRRAGGTVSKRELLEHVWDEMFDGDENIVEVYVARLRAKLGRDRIETIRGAGYRVPGSA